LGWESKSKHVIEFVSRQTLMTQKISRIGVFGVDKIRTICLLTLARQGNGCGTNLKISYRPYSQ
jgi:hypothetical protein